MPKRITHHVLLAICELEIPVKVVGEPRRSVRYYLGKRGGILRLPQFLFTEQLNQELEKYKAWLKFHFNTRGHLIEHFRGKVYRDGDALTVGQRKYHLKIQETCNKNHFGTLEGNTITLFLNKNDSFANRSSAVKHLLSRLVASDFYPWVIDRVAMLNKLYFNQCYNKVTLRYNLSNWGSCSAKRNINLSTCLLFAPLDVIDYVIIHELAHLIEMNHSPRFWALVESVMPDYKDKVSWLKNNWASCNF